MLNYCIRILHFSSIDTIDSEVFMDIDATYETLKFPLGSIFR